MRWRKLNIQYESSLVIVRIILEAQNLFYKCFIIPGLITGNLQQCSSNLNIFVTSSISFSIRIAKPEPWQPSGKALQLTSQRQCQATFMPWGLPLAQLESASLWWSEGWRGAGPWSLSSFARLPRHQHTGPTGQHSCWQRWSPLPTAWWVHMRLLWQWPSARRSLVAAPLRPQVPVAPPQRKRLLWKQKTLCNPA